MTVLGGAVRSASKCNLYHLLHKVDIFSKSEHRDSIAANSANGIATPELSQALEPRHFLNAVFLWSGVKVNLRVIRSCERGCKYWNVRSPRIATSSDRLSIITGGSYYG